MRSWKGWQWYTSKHPSQQESYGQGNGTSVLAGYGNRIAEGAEPGRLGRGRLQPKGTRVFMGEGLPPVPDRLVERIRRWEYIDMYKLLPELLADQKGEGTGAGAGKQLSRAKKQLFLLYLFLFF